MNAKPQAGQDQRGSLARTAAICAVLLAAGAAALFVIFNTEPTAEREGAVRQSASLVDITRGDFGSFRPVIEAMGTVRPAREIALSARVEGEILEMHESFVPGGFVEAGQLLVRIDDADYRVALQRSRSALEQALASLEIEQAEQSAAAADYQRLDRELPPQRRALVLREPQGRAARASVEAARANLEQAQMNLGRTRIDAPFDAHVLSRDINLGSQVGPGTGLARLVGLETFWVEATVPVSHLPWLAIPDGGTAGSRALIRNRTAWPAGAVREGEVFRLIGELEGATRLARILISVDDPLARQGDTTRPRLMLGEYVEARIDGREIVDVVRLERQYIRADDTVWLMVDGRLSIRPVSIVFQDERYAYIDQGLAPDDLVVTTRLATVREGLRLRVEEDEVDHQDGGP